MKGSWHSGQGVSLLVLVLVVVFGVAEVSFVDEEDSLRLRLPGKTINGKHCNVCLLFSAGFPEYLTKVAKFLVLHMKT